MRQLLYVPIAVFIFVLNAFGIQEQKSTPFEQDVVHKIQNKIQTNKSLSPEAQNIGVFQKHNYIILKGSVRSEVEKVKVGKIADEASGDMKILNDITVIK